MEEIKNKYYIRLNENNQIIKTFSNIFEEPVEGDVLINEGYGSQFRATKENLSQELQQYSDVENGLQVVDESGSYILKYENGVIRKLTYEEIEMLLSAEISKLKKSTTKKFNILNKLMGITK